MADADAIARRRPGKPAPPQPPAGLGDMLGGYTGERLLKKRRRPIKRLNVAADTSIGEMADDDATDRNGGPGNEQA
jgi:hypothetical protein